MITELLMNEVAFFALFYFRCQFYWKKISSMKTKTLGITEVLVTETGRLEVIKYPYTSASINRLAHELEQPGVFQCIGVTDVCTLGPLHIVTCISC